MKVYIASSFRRPERKANVLAAKKILEEKGLSCYVPMENKIKDAWSLPNVVWARRVFEMDIEALKKCDAVVFVFYGDEKGEAGSAFECGYASALGIPVVGVMMRRIPISLMLGAAMSAMVDGLEGLGKLDFSKKLEKTPIRELR
jgi:nucleoside 2-deoxyribosyltransferase